MQGLGEIDLDIDPKSTTAIRLDMGWGKAL